MTIALVKSYAQPKNLKNNLLLTAQLLSYLVFFFLLVARLFSTLYKGSMRNCIGQSLAKSYLFNECKTIQRVIFLVAFPFRNSLIGNKISVDQHLFIFPFFFKYITGVRQFGNKAGIMSF